MNLKTLRHQLQPKCFFEQIIPRSVFNFAPPHLFYLRFLSRSLPPSISFFSFLTRVFLNTHAENGGGRDGYRAGEAQRGEKGRRQQQTRRASRSHSTSLHRQMIQLAEPHWYKLIIIRWSSTNTKMEQRVVKRKKWKSLRWWSKILHFYTCFWIFLVSLGVWGD